MTMKEKSESLRPYEKCLLKGAQTLSDEELLAVIIRCGTKNENSVALAERVLSLGAQGGGLLNIMDLSVKDLMKVRGIGKVKAVQVKCIGELSRRIVKCSHNRQMKFDSAQSVADYYMEDMRYLKREKIMALMLDTACHYVGEYEVSLGTVNTSIISPREIFIAALKCEAVNIILVHNHPSGNPEPSSEDVVMTGNISSIGKFIGIGIIDHIIIGDNTYISLRDKGIIN